MQFWVVSVFIGEGVNPLKGGNPLAVFPNAEALTEDQMQALAQTMNLSESTFVTSTNTDGYSVRIFTPDQELPFAGHPTIGTSWLLRRMNRLSGDRFIQSSPAGDTEITVMGDELWFERTGHSGRDLEARDPEASRSIAAAFGIDASDVGLDASKIGGSGDLMVATADGGLEQLMVPVRDDSVLGRCSPRSELVSVHEVGVYCFTALGEGRLASRGLIFLGSTAAEDPATGSAAAGLGLYLADRGAGGNFEILQGREMGRPSRILMRCEPGKVSIGGRCEPIFKGELEALPA
jgi:trans-2,3-dihydro-3-hydroxyanthranilate isomerase